MYIKKFIDKVLLIATDVIDKFIIHHRRNVEKRKFRDPRRMAIWKSVELTADQKQEIDDFYLEHYGQKVPTIWHRHFMAYCGRFDKAFIPELIYIPEFEYFMNPYKEYVSVLSDKNCLYSFAKRARVKMPKPILFNQKGFIWGDGVKGRAFIKPTVDSCSGRGCRIIDIDDGNVDKVSGESIESIVSEYGNDYVIQEIVSCHNSIADIYPNGVNTFRIITYRWKNEIKHIPSIMRIGRGGSFIDNAHAGGMFIGIYEDGSLCPVAFTEFKECFTKHPDTNVVFNGYKIDLFPKVLEAACEMHKIVPQVGVVNWDFTIDAEGDPLLIEANTSGGSIWLSQMAHGVAPFGEDTADILQWLRKNKKCKKTKRELYYYGK